MPRVVVVAYDPAWPAAFEAIRARIAPALAGIAGSIEHVGSTSAPGLAAKPIIDIDVAVPDSAAAVAAAVAALATLGYEHRGDLGIAGREAFTAPAGGVFAHHLYVCREGSLALRNHLALRDYLRAHPADATEYGSLKQGLAARYPDDINAYVAGKAPFVLGVLERCGFSAQELAAIAAQNGALWPPVNDA